MCNKTRESGSERRGERVRSEKEKDNENRLRLICQRAGDLSMYMSSH